jgi:hypothetical protein
MGFLTFAIAALQFLASLFGTFGHVASTCVNVPVAIHASANAGLELDPHLAGAVIGSTPAC